jgi:hypothetical protein
MADEFQFTARNGSIATDFDSLNGQWAANGTTLYLLFRLHVRPEADVEGLLDEYYQAFGPAGPQVKAYFDFWEHHSTSNRLVSADVMRRNHADNQYAYLRAAYELYPTQTFVRAEAILKQAADAARESDPLYGRRVEFLQLGLEHARMVRQLSELFSAKAPQDTIRRHVEDLVAFRRRTEHLIIADFMRAANSENAAFGKDFDFNLYPMARPQITIKATRP